VKVPLIDPDDVPAVAALVIKKFPKRTRNVAT
jgi:hypothetical protein